MDNLEQRDEIYQVIICEKDLVGNIQEFMDENIPKSHLLIFIGTKNSIASEACLHELALALIHGIEIIPIKGMDIEWNDLNHIDLRQQKQGYLDLGLEKGIEFNSINLNKFFDELYTYIRKYKREINLFETTQVKLEKERSNMLSSINNFINSELFEENLKQNLRQFEELFQALSKNQIAPSEYLLECAKIISKKLT